MLEKCSDIGSNIIKCYGNHSCKPENGGCVDKQCSHYKISSDCALMVHSYDPHDIVKNITICSWIDGSCVESTPQQLN